MKFGELMAGLTGLLGVEGGFEPDASGIVNVDAGGVVLSFLEQTDYPVPGRDALILWGRFDGLTDENVDALAAEMLRANDRPDAPGGPTLALLGETICLQQTLFLDMLDVETLARETNDFVRVLLDWHARVQDGASATGEGFTAI